MRKLIPYVVGAVGILGALDVACGSDPSIGFVPDSDAGDLQNTDAGTQDSGSPPTPAAFAIGGKVVGLLGTGMVLQNNGGDDLTVNADGNFVFKTTLAKGKPFAVTVKNQPTAPAQKCTVSGGTGTVANSNVTTVVVNCATNAFTIGGTVSGLAGTGLVLQNNLGDDATIAADGTFAFATPVADGGAYAVTIKTQPKGLSQTCSVADGAGSVAGKNVTNVAVTCVTDKFTVGGSVSGLTGSGLVLKNNGAGDLAIAADGTFTFTASQDDGTDFAVTVGTDPTNPEQTCLVSGGTGKIAGGNVTSVAVNCSTKKYSIGGTVSGLDGTGLVLQNNAGDDLTVTANGTFAFAMPIDDHAAYTVTVKGQPKNKSQTCTVTNGSGNVAAAAVTNVAINCTTNSYAVKGTVTGLAGTGLVLQNNAGDDLPIAADGAFAFTTPVASGSTYLVTTLSNPDNKSQTCTVTNGTGTIGGADVTDVTVTCVTNKYAIGGNVTGLVGTGLVLTNNGVDDLPIAADGTFAFATTIESGQAFDVAVKAQPSAPNQTCVVTGGSGTVASGNIVSVAVNCTTNTYTAGGTVSGLAGTGLVLQNNGGGDVPINANGTFAMNPQNDGTGYAITVKTQPTAKSQTCTVTNGTGTIGGANVTNVGVSCVTNTYSVGGTVSGLVGTVVLQNNAGDDKSIAANGAFTFTTQVASGAPYAVTVKTQPATVVCTVASGSGTVTNTAITNVTVTCAVPATSCQAIKNANPAATDGTYTIDPDGAGPFGALSVWCDMTTDGGGYTSYAINGGINTSRYDQANSCTAIGLKLAIPRTQAHLDALYAKYGINYFKVVPGVYGLAAGNYTGCAMNSTDPTCSANWKALDGGQWFAKKAAYSEPNGDYTPGCWLGLDGTGVDASGFVRFNDLGCGYSTGASYVCSDNVKGSHVEFAGIQQNLPVANLTGWTQCYLDTYAKNNGQLAQEIVAACTKANVMLACRPTGATTLTLAADAPRADVFFDTGTGNTPHNANNVGWYFNNDYSMGFAPQGEAISRGQADTLPGATRLSWHTLSQNSGGYRCGDVTGLNGSTSYERVVYQAD